ncbi:hypothetical protein [Microbaculum marinisediminis]|uniref:Uncharacterized protein n=1 Tax=Microbaculum marinisediminis TaxID=2931392 RepID=A0AAW5QVW6_9HYPH|nr:hypothetical protein [Microbaculum sp. A6E488]MCT8972047.1 hypothetical protein [Microbaculum sp. A6E488]
MDNTLTKAALIDVATALNNNEKIEAGLVDPFLDHTFEELSSFSRFMLKVAAAISLFFASVLVIFPEVGEKLIEWLPGFFLLPERLSKALDYVWGLVGKPVGQQHLMYHVPNIIVYAFGVVGIRQVWKRVHKNNWKDLVASAQEKLARAIEDGTGLFRFAPGFSLLFVGEGDHIARSLVADDPTIGLTISSRQQPYTKLWARFAAGEGDEGFVRALGQVNAEDAGEYVLFPVRDEHLFLPGPLDFDIAPHRVDVAVRRIREFEKERAWKAKRIIIVGDKEQRSNFITEGETGRIATDIDEVSLRTIADKYENMTILDPTETTIQAIVAIAAGRRILFRSSDRGVEKYGREFYRRLSLLGYSPTSEEALTIGYDISDLETEHQLLSQAYPAYLPVILSRDIFDGLVKSGLWDDSYIFIPRLVKQELQRLVGQQ